MGWNNALLTKGRKDAASSVSIASAGLSGLWVLPETPMRVMACTMPILLQRSYFSLTRDEGATKLMGKAGVIRSTCFSHARKLTVYPDQGKGLS